MAYYTQEMIREIIEGYTQMYIHWACDVNNRKSTSGYLFTSTRAAVMWQSKKQKVLPFLQPRLNIWHWPAQHKRLSG